MKEAVTSTPLFERIEDVTSEAIEIRCQTVSEILGKQNLVAMSARAHIVRWFLNPDKWSPFDKKTRLIRKLIPHKYIIPLMQRLGYDGIIALWNQRIIWHAFFQKHTRQTRDELHLFSVAVAEELRWRWIGTMISQTLIEFGRKPERKIEKMRIWGGGDPTVKTIFQKVSSRAQALWIRTDDDYFVYFLDRTERPISGIIGPRKS